MSRPLAVESQRNTEGVGYKASAFEPWWDSLYDQAAANITLPKTSSKSKKERNGKSGMIEKGEKIGKKDKAKEKKKEKNKEEEKNKEKEEKNKEKEKKKNKEKGKASVGTTSG